MNQKGILYGVGVGPGDPNLMTLQAVQKMQDCAVIACPETNGSHKVALAIAGKAVDLSNKTVLTLPFPMTRDENARQAAYQDAVQRLEERLEQGTDVAFLTLGDVSIYSTFAYLAQLAEADGFQTEILPGVPSFSAVAAKLGIPIAIGAEPFHVIPASADLDALRDALQLPGTKVLMKSGKQIPEVLEALSELDLLNNTSLVENCGLPEEKILRAPTPEDAADLGYIVTLIVRESL